MNAVPEVVSTPITASSASKGVSDSSRNKSLDYTDITIVIGTKDKDGVRQEQVHLIDGDEVELANVALSFDRKMKPCKDEEGNLLGFEPTGEVQVKLGLKYYEG